MSLYEIENVSKSGHVFVGLRGIQTLKPGQKKIIELSDADRNGPEIVALEGEHVEIRAAKRVEKKAEEKKAEEKPSTEPPKKEELPKKP